MRGWRYIGRLEKLLDGYHGDEFELTQAKDAYLPERGDILAIAAAARDGRFRAGYLRVRDVEPFQVGPRIRCAESIRGAVTGACDQDHVYVATAIGEDAFRSNIPRGRGWPTDHEADCPALAGDSCRCPLGNL